MRNKFLQKGKSDDWATPKNIYEYFIEKLKFYDPCKLYELKEKNNIFNDFGNSKNGAPFASLFVVLNGIKSNIKSINTNGYLNVGINILNNF